MRGVFRQFAMFQDGFRLPLVPASTVLPECRCVSVVAVLEGNEHCARGQWKRFSNFPGEKSAGMVNRLESQMKATR